MTVEVIDRPPDCSAASPSVAVLWPPNHRFNETRSALTAGRKTESMALP